MMSYKFVATCQDCRHRLKGICAIVAQIPFSAILIAVA